MWNHLQVWLLFKLQECECDIISLPSGGCGSPVLSPNASVEGYNDTVEGLVVIYRCNPGLIPEGEFRSVCREDTDTWDPDPASLMCREPGTSGRSDTCILISFVVVLYVIVIAWEGVLYAEYSTRPCPESCFLHTALPPMP